MSSFFSSNIVVSVEVAFVSVRTKKWGESRNEVEMVGAEAEVTAGGWMELKKRVWR